MEAFDHHAVLTGDLEGDGLNTLSQRPAALPPLDVFLAPHHGGRTANPRWLYDWAEPRLVVASQRSPAPGATDALAGLPMSVLRTWQRGAIHLRWTPAGVTVHGFRDLKAQRSD